MSCFALWTGCPSRACYPVVDVHSYSDMAVCRRIVCPYISFNIPRSRGYLGVPTAGGPPGYCGNTDRIAGEKIIAWLCVFSPNRHRLKERQGLIEILTLEVHRPAIRGTMTKSDFDRLLERYLNGEISDEERIKLEAWLDVAKTKSSESAALSREAEDQLFRRITSNLDNLDEIVAMGRRQGKGFSAGKWILRIAATLLVLMAISYGVWYTAQRHHTRPEMASVTQVDKLILADGSLVWLRGESKLVYYEKPDEGIRYSELQGEALFEVAKDSSRPFIIQCGDVRLRVLGTSFAVKTRVNELELKVLTGKVNLSSARDNVTVDVVSNEQVIYRGNGKIEKFALGRETVDAVTESTEYNMRFSDVAMAEVFRKIERKFNVTIRLEDPDVGHCRVTADLTDHSLESTLQMITEVLAVNYSREGHTITFRGSGCR